VFTVLVIIAGLLIGWFRKGSLWSIANISFRLIWLLPSAYILEYISVHHLQGHIYEICILLAYLGLTWFCLLNYRVAGIKWALAGTIANILVMSVNGLRMPAYLPAIREIAPQTIPALMKGEYLKSVAMTSHTHLNPLGDIFNVSVLTPNLVSVGDLLFSLGIIIFLQHAMRSSLEVNQSSVETQKW
jgi:hypothetical protein